MPSGGMAAHQLQEKNPVLQLNDIRKDCVYELKQALTKTHEKRFIFKLMIDGKIFEGAGPSKKEAKAAAATKALKHAAVNVNASVFKAQLAQRTKNMNMNMNLKKQPPYVKKNANKKNDESIQYIDGKQVCQFYLSSLCVRGKNCPYLHLEYSSKFQLDRKLPLNPQVPAKGNYSWLKFCNNFINLRCPRTDCKYLHVSKDDAQIYCGTGKIPPHVVEQAVRKAMAEDIAPPGMTQTCKANLEGQCNWQSCPFRHLSRNEFAHEVLESLHREFEMRLSPRDDYRPFASRVLDQPSSLMERESFGVSPLGVSALGSEVSRRLFEERSHTTDYKRSEAEWLASSMKNLMRDRDMGKASKLQGIEEELRALQEENERLRGSARHRTAEEENYFRRVPQERSLRNDYLAEKSLYQDQSKVPQERSLRNDYLAEKSLYQDQLQKLEEENAQIKRLLTREREGRYMQQSDPLFGNNLHTDEMSELRRQNLEMYNFDKLLDTELKRRAGQGMFHQGMMGLPMTSQAFSMPKNGGIQQMNQKNQINWKNRANQMYQANQMYKLQTNKNTALMPLPATRPSFQVKNKGNSQYNNRFIQKKKPKMQLQQQQQQKQQQQKQQQNAKAKAKPKPVVNQQKQKAKATSKEKPVVALEAKKEESQTQEQSEEQQGQSLEQRTRRKRKTEKQNGGAAAASANAVDVVVENNSSEDVVIENNSSDEDVDVDVVGGEQNGLESHESEHSEDDSSEANKQRTEGSSSTAEKEEEEKKPEKNEEEEKKPEKEKNEETVKSNTEETASTSDRWADAKDF